MQEENKQAIEQQTQEPLIAVGENGVERSEEEYPAVGESGAPEPVEAPQDKQEKKPAAGGRRDILHLVCGGYLLYLAYKLLTSFLKEYPQTGWTTNLVVCIVGTIVFAIVGVVLLAGCVKRFLQHMKDSNEH